MTYKLGKLAARRPYGLADLSVYANGKLPAPPRQAHYGASVTAAGVPWGMLGNDTYGDCVMAGIGHDILMSNYDEYGQDITVPTEQQVVSEYFTLTGGQDSGLNIADTLNVWQSEGLFGNKIAAYAPVNFSDITEVQQGIAYFGGLLIGVQLPQSAEEQFPNEWTVVPDSPILGGHCILLTGYNQDRVYACTWGQLIIGGMTWPWFAKYCDEAWAIVSTQAEEAAKGPNPGYGVSNLNLSQLKADIAALNT